MAEALAYLEDEGVCHRDVKSSNIFIRANGNMELSGFGLAQYIEVGNLTLHNPWLEKIMMHQETGVTGYRGTPLYMAP